jgi:hypothetical protein
VATLLGGLIALFAHMVGIAATQLWELKHLFRRHNA